MKRKVRLFHVVTSPHGWDAKRADGRSAFQVKAAVWATSKKAAAQAFGMSVYEFNNYGHEGWPSVEAELVDLPPGVVAVRGLDPGDTVNGEVGWLWEEARLDPTD